MRDEKGRSRPGGEGTHDGNTRLFTAEENAALGGRFFAIAHRFTPFARRWGVMLLTASVAIGVGAGYFFVPTPPPVTVRLPEARPAMMGAVAGMAAPSPRRLPLGTPFTRGHERRRTLSESRPSLIPPVTPPTPSIAASRSGSAGPAQLVGVVTTAENSRAILLWKGRQVVLAPGDSDGMLTLLSVAEDTARVREAGTEHVLHLPRHAAEAERCPAPRREGRG